MQRACNCKLQRAWGRCLRVSVLAFHYWLRLRFTSLTHFSDFSVMDKRRYFQKFMWIKFLINKHSRSVYTLVEENRSVWQVCSGTLNRRAGCRPYGCKSIYIVLRSWLVIRWCSRLTLQGCPFSCFLMLDGNGITSRDLVHSDEWLTAPCSHLRYMMHLTDLGLE